MEKDRKTQIKENLDILQEKLSFTADSCGRKAEEIRLMAVSKTKPLSDIKAAYEAGQRLFGENRIQEAEQKFAELPEDAELHMIGHLQSNKARIAALCAACVQSIDKFKTAAELNKYAEAFDNKIDILIEINTSGEESKSGYRDYDDFKKDLEAISGLKNLNLRGLMTIAPFTDDEKLIRKSFSTLYGYFQKLQDDAEASRIDVLSMGMSSDFELAVKEGSTLVRVGTAIFGSRF